MTKIWVFDVEGDSLTPTKLHCLAASNPQTTSIHVTPSYDKMRKILTEADILIGHNIIRWDIVQVERLLGIKIKAKLVDTLALSWYLFPADEEGVTRHEHGLEEWGEHYGIKKPFILDWESQTQEEYEHRCKEDVKINVRLWNDMYRYLMDLYSSDKEIWRLIDYLQFKMHCARLQEKSKWKVDIEYVENSLIELKKIQGEKTVALSKVMPRVPDIQIKSKPKKFINKDGSYSKLGMEWNALLCERGLPFSHEDDIEIIKGYEEGNPGSVDQVKSWLYSLGWVPETLKHTKNKKTGEKKSVPQINLEHGKGICPSIKKLFEKEPSLELLDGLSVLQHRIGILNGFLRDHEDGWIKAQISGFTNTLRVKHTTVVNLPKVEKLHAESIRGGLVSIKGYLLCGSDMSGQEDKIKQHYIFPLDPDYVHSMDQEDWDPHLEIAILAGMLTREQVNQYKAGDKRWKPVRDIAKNGGYALQWRM